MEGLRCEESFSLVEKSPKIGRNVGLVLFRLSDSLVDIFRPLNLTDLRPEEHILAPELDFSTTKAPQ